MKNLDVLFVQKKDIIQIFGQNDIILSNISVSCWFLKVIIVYIIYLFEGKSVFIESNLNGVLIPLLTCGTRSISNFPAPFIQLQSKSKRSLYPLHQIINWFHEKKYPELAMYK